MRVALVGPELEENLALRYIHASVEGAGHEARIFDFHAADQIPALAAGIAQYAPHVVGLSLVTKLSPSHLVGLTMGGWFLASAFGNNFSGFFGGIQHAMSPVAFFLLLSGLAALASLFIYLLLPRLEEAIKQYGA